MAGREIQAGAAYVVVGLKNRIDAGAKGVQSSLNNLSKNAMQKGASLAKLGATITASAGGFLTFPIKAASDMQETMSKFQVVFGDSAGDMLNWSDSAALAMGVSKQEMAAMLSSMQDLLVPMGVVPDAASGMSQELSKLAIDLASFNNMSVKKTFEDMMSAMTGSGEVMKKYGVILTETAVKQEMMAMGMDPKTADDAAKAQARLNIIMRSTTAAQGDAIRTADGFANQMKRLWATGKDVAAAFGGPLLDDLAKVMSLLNGGAGFIRDFVTQNTELIRVIGLSIVAVGGIGVALTAMGGTLFAIGIAVSGLASAVGFLATVFGTLVSPIGLTIAAVAGLGYALLEYTTLGVDALNWLKEKFGPLVETVQNAIGAIQAAIGEGDFTEAWVIATDLMELAWLSMTGVVQDAWGELMGYILDAGSVTAGGIGQVFESLGNLLKGMLDAYRSYYDTVFNFVTEKIGEGNGVRTIGGSGGGKSAFDAQFGGITSQLEDAIDGVKTFGQAMQDEARGQIESRMEQRDADKAERAARIDQVRESIQEATTEAATSVVVDGKDGDMKRSEIDFEKAKELEKFTGEALASEKARTGPSATFDAFAASLIGMGGSGRDESLIAAKETAKNTALIAKEAKKDAVPRFA